ncbi:MAG: Crp/Fnr family transcriptional regulator [Bacteroidota bacterium]|nr:Crp/Fnr family transcriptional regulator [Bacteroidota bacterium]
MASFLDSFTGGTLSDKDLQMIRSTIVTRKVYKGDYLLRKGDLIKKGFFVKSGCLRSYTLDEKGKEHIYMFGPEGWLVSDIEAQVKDKPAELYIDAIEDSEVEIIDHSIFSIVATTPKEFARLTKRISVLQKRIILLMSATLQERYLDFVKTYPNILQRVPQKMVASYLGVTPEALSKIRGDLQKINSKDNYS